MIKRLIKRMLGISTSADIDLLIGEAIKVPRYTRHKCSFRGMELEVTDFISVAFQLNEYFVDEAFKFKAARDVPIIYDCGANVGIATLYFKKAFPKARIKAFEPDPVIFMCLKNNLIKNSVTNVELLNAAVWSDSNGIEFGSDGADSGSIYHEANRTKVPTVRLADELSKEDSVDLLKIDIEGAEVEVINDCSDELGKVQNLFVEYHSWQKNPQRLDELLRHLTQSGFRYYIRSIGEVHRQLFLDNHFASGMDVQLNIFAINTLLS